MQRPTEDRTKHEASNVLSKKLIYKTSILGAHFGWDTLEIFARHQPLSHQKLKELDLLSCIICTQPNYEHYIVMSVWYRFYVAGSADSIFIIFSNPKTICNYTTCHNLALGYKFELSEFTVFNGVLGVMETEEYKLAMDEFPRTYDLDPVKSIGGCATSKYQWWQVAVSARDWSSIWKD